MKYFIIFLLFTLLVSCANEGKQVNVTEINKELDLNSEFFYFMPSDLVTYELDNTLTAEPEKITAEPEKITAEPKKVTASSVEKSTAIPNTPSTVANNSNCYDNPDRFNWIKYAEIYDWPLDEGANVVKAESGGDLCAINSSSGASCWWQIYPPPSDVLDPARCTYYAYVKWSDGRNFYNHWYKFWQ